VADLINGLEIRKRLGPKTWGVPVPFGPDGFRFVRHADSAKIIVSCAPANDPVSDCPVEWIHASISSPHHLPGYDDLTTLHFAVWGDAGHAYQAFVPPTEHVNLHPRALHLWGRADGPRVLPNFGFYGSI
jgi:hypothetical protein